MIGQRERFDRFELRRAAGLTPYINHAAELTALERAWRRAEALQGQVVLVAGEAGIGKSRLLQEFNGKIPARPISALPGMARPTCRTARCGQ